LLHGKNSFVEDKNLAKYSYRNNFNSTEP